MTSAKQTGKLMNERIKIEEREKKDLQMFFQFGTSWLYKWSKNQRKCKYIVIATMKLLPINEQQQQQKNE